MLMLCVLLSNKCCTSKSWLLKIHHHDVLLNCCYLTRSFLVCFLMSNSIHHIPLKNATNQWFNVQEKLTKTVLDCTKLLKLGKVYNFIITTAVIIQLISVGYKNS